MYRLGLYNIVASCAIGATVLSSALMGISDRALAAPGQAVWCNGVRYWGACPSSSRPRAAPSDDDDDSVPSAPPYAQSPAVQTMKRAEAAANRGDYEEAIQLLQRALQSGGLIPADVAGTRRNLAIAHAQIAIRAVDRGDLEEAVRLLELAVRYRPNQRFVRAGEDKYKDGTGELYSAYAARLREEIADKKREAREALEAERQAGDLLQQEQERQRRAEADRRKREAEQRVKEEQERRAKAEAQRKEEQERQRRAEEEQRKREAELQAKEKELQQREEKLRRAQLEQPKDADMNLLFPQDFGRLPGRPNSNAPLINPLREPERYKEFLAQEREKFPEQKVLIDKLLANMDRIEIDEVKRRERDALSAVNNKFQVEVDNALASVYRQTGAKNREELFALRDKNPELQKIIDEKLTPVHTAFTAERKAIINKTFHELLELANNISPLDDGAARDARIRSEQQRTPPPNERDTSTTPQVAQPKQAQQKQAETNNKLAETVAQNCTGWMSQQNGTSYRLCVGERAQRYCEQSDGTSISQIPCQ